MTHMGEGLLILIVIGQFFIIACMTGLSYRISGGYEKGSAGYVIKGIIWSLGFIMTAALAIAFISLASTPHHMVEIAHVSEKEEQPEQEGPQYPADSLQEEAEVHEDSTEPYPEDPVQSFDDKTTDGMVAIYAEYFAPLGVYKYETDWSAKGEPGAVLYEDDDNVRFLRYDRESKNGECLLYVYYEGDKKDPSVTNDSTHILDMYAYVIETGEVIDSGKTAWADAGTPEYREATGE